MSHFSSAGHQKKIHTFGSSMFKRENTGRVRIIFYPARDFSTIAIELMRLINRILTTEIRMNIVTAL
jgi:hypothetical protein